jgi:hypothetical protein
MRLSNAKKNVEREPIKVALFTANYKEQVTWRDAATGGSWRNRTSSSPWHGSPITLGFGGRVYFPTGGASLSCRSCRSPPLPAGSREIQKR